MERVRKMLKWSVNTSTNELGQMAREYAMLNHYDLI